MGFFDGADEAAPFVDDAGAPVEADDLVADRVDAVGRVEGGQLVGQQLADREEGEGADAQQVALVRVVHDDRHLAVLVAVDVDAPENGQRRQLVVLVLTFGHVLRTEDGLVLEEDAALFDGAAQMVDARTANLFSPIKSNVNH